VNRVRHRSCSFVMAGLGPVIHVFVDSIQAKSRMATSLRRS
jgi:hypothetical protein